ncbi:Apolipoprotein D [Habropoda laboriosa]|uniref:Apolipoprotein D n=3 Tax=Habropoda laboriosa TaxID=597456 RepID=A0A0L7QPH9_9HYME|nr:Apolipoprotein D [Habropoda laboriosa]
MIGKIVFILSALALARAQIPSLGFCPDYVPMANFDMTKFLGVWYEAERYFQLTEVISRCVTTNYTSAPGGKIRVSNEVTNRFTGIKRVVEGEVKRAPSKAEAGKLTVKYTIPLTPETKYSILETDYDSYAVLWSCSGIGPFHTQNAWVMTRERLAPGTVLQKAYAVLDKYKISKTFFVKTDQEDCAYLDTNPVAPAEETAENSSEENVRQAIAPDVPEIIVEIENAKEEEKLLLKKSEAVESGKRKPVNIIPERIMEIAAEAAKEEMPMDDAKIEEPKATEAVKEKPEGGNVKQTEKAT